MQQYKTATTCNALPHVPVASTIHACAGVTINASSEEQATDCNVSQVRTQPKWQCQCQCPQGAQNKLHGYNNPRRVTIAGTCVQLGCTGSCRYRDHSGKGSHRVDQRLQHPAPFRINVEWGEGGEAGDHYFRTRMTLQRTRQRVHVRDSTYAHTSRQLKVLPA